MHASKTFRFFSLFLCFTTFFITLSSAGFTQENQPTESKPNWKTISTFSFAVGAGVAIAAVGSLFSEMAKKKAKSTFKVKKSHDPYGMAVMLVPVGNQMMILVTPNTKFGLQEEITTTIDWDDNLTEQEKKDRVDVGFRQIAEKLDRLKSKKVPSSQKKKFRKSIEATKTALVALKNQLLQSVLESFRLKQRNAELEDENQTLRNRISDLEGNGEQEEEETEEIQEPTFFSGEEEELDPEVEAAEAPVRERLVQLFQDASQIDRGLSQDLENMGERRFALSVLRTAYQQNNLPAIANINTYLAWLQDIEAYDQSFTFGDLVDQNVLFAIQNKDISFEQLFLSLEWMEFSGSSSELEVFRDLFEGVVRTLVPASRNRRDAFNPRFMDYANHYFEFVENLRDHPMFGDNKNVDRYIWEDILLQDPDLLDRVMVGYWVDNDPFIILFKNAKLSVRDLVLGEQYINESELAPEVKRVFLNHAIVSDFILSQDSLIFFDRTSIQIDYGSDQPSSDIGADFEAPEYDSIVISQLLKKKSEAWIERKTISLKLNILNTRSALDLETSPLILEFLKARHGEKLNQLNLEIERLDVELGELVEIRQEEEDQSKNWGIRSILNIGGADSRFKIPLENMFMRAPEDSD